jgi:hypothetical protein
MLVDGCRNMACLMIVFQAFKNHPPTDVLT